MQELTLYDIPFFDPELGRTLLEFQALVARKKFWESTCGETTAEKPDLEFRNTKVEDICLDFTLPGFADYVLASGVDHKTVRHFLNICDECLFFNGFYLFDCIFKNIYIIPGKYRKLR